MTLDANIIIAYLAGESPVVEAIKYWRKQGRPLILPAVAETEVLSFAGWSPAELYIAKDFLKDNFTSIAFDRVIARITADVRRTVKIKLPDAAIAATALFTNTALVTRNQADFKNVQGLQIITV